MAMAAAEPAPAEVMTWARGSTTLPAAQTPATLVRPVPSTMTKPAWSSSHPKPGKQAVGVGDVAGSDEHGRASDHPTVGELDTGQLVGLDHEPDDLAALDPDASCIELGLFGRRDDRGCARRRPRRRTTAERVARGGPRRDACRARRAAGRGPPNRGSTGSAGGRDPIAPARRGCRAARRRPRSPRGCVVPRAPDRWRGEPRSRVRSTTPGPRTAPRRSR